MLAMRAYMRAKTVDGVIDEDIAKRVGLTGQQIEDMYQIMAIANYEDRFVIPTAHREIERGRLRPARLLRLHIRQRLLRRRHRDQSVRHAQARPRPRWRSCDDADLQGAVGAADLPDRGAAGGAAGDRGRVSTRKALLPAASRAVSSICC